MEKTVFLRHDLAFITDKGKKLLQEQLLHFYQGTMLDMVEEILMGTADVPGIVRRDEPLSPETIPIGFVHYLRLEDNRIRIPARVPIAEVSRVIRPYEVIDLPVTPRHRCIEAAVKLAELGRSMNVRVGVLGSVALEMATELPYTDLNSDLDLLLQEASLERLSAFAKEARCLYPDVRMDVEVEFRNGYGVKMAEIFADTKTVLGKSLHDVALLERQQITEYLS